MSDEKGRPTKGDKIKTIYGPKMEGRVIETFYENGEGGMHVQYEHGCSWTSCKNVEIITE